jgi:uncharacterized membrane protein YgcG
MGASSNLCCNLASFASCCACQRASDLLFGRAVGSIFIDVSIFEEDVKIDKRRRSSIGATLLGMAEDPEADGEEGSHSAKPSGESPHKSGGGHSRSGSGSFLRRHGHGHQQQQNRRGSVVNMLGGALGLSKKRSQGSVSSDRELPGLGGASPSPDGVRPAFGDFNSLYGAPSAAEGGGGTRSYETPAMMEARLAEERMAAEVRLHTMWRFMMHDCPGLEAEVAKLHASETAKQVLREWEAEQDILRKQQQITKEYALMKKRAEQQRREQDAEKRPTTDPPNSTAPGAGTAPGMAPGATPGAAPAPAMALAVPPTGPGADAAADAPGSAASAAGAGAPSAIGSPAEARPAGSATGSGGGGSGGGSGNEGGGGGGDDGGDGAKGDGSSGEEEDPAPPRGTLETLLFGDNRKDRKARASGDRSAPSAATDRGHSSNQPGLASQSPGGSVSHRPEPSDSSLLSA